MTNVTNVLKHEIYRTFLEALTKRTYINSSPADELDNCITKEIVPQQDLQKEKDASGTLLVINTYTFCAT